MDIEARVNDLASMFHRKNDDFWAMSHREENALELAANHMPEQMRGADAATWFADFLKEFRRRMLEDQKPADEKPADPTPSNPTPTTTDVPPATPDDDSSQHM